MTETRKWFLLAGIINFALIFAMFILVLKIINKYDPFLKREKKKKAKKKLTSTTKDTSMNYTNYFPEKASESTVLGTSLLENDYGSGSYGTKTRVLSRVQPAETRLLEALTKEIEQASSSNGSTGDYESNSSSGRYYSNGSIKDYESNSSSGRYYSNSIATANVPLTEKKWVGYMNDYRRELEGGDIIFTSIDAIKSSLVDDTKDKDGTNNEESKESKESKQTRFYIDVVSHGTNFLFSKKRNANGMFQLFTRKKTDNLFDIQEVKKQGNSLVLGTGLIPTILRDKRGNITLDKIKETLKMCSTSEDEGNRIIIARNVKVVFKGYDASDNCLNGTKDSQNVNIVLCNVDAERYEKSIERAYMSAYLAALDSGSKSLFLTLLEGAEYPQESMYNSIWSGLKETVMCGTNKTLSEVHLIVHEASSELATFYNFLSNNNIDVKIHKE